MKATLIAQIAQNCEWHKSCNDTYMAICESNITELESCLPHGSGIVSGCKIDIEQSGKNKVVINTSFHHMNENGYYDGWTEYKVIVTPILLSNNFDIKITGKDRNAIKDYLHDVFNWSLNSTGNLPE